MRKGKIKKILAIMLVMMLAVIVVPVQTQAAARISAASKTLNVGETTTLKVYGTSSKIKWSSSNKSVASVNQKGKITAKSEGTAIIKAKVSKKTLKCTINVKSKFSANEATKNISCTLQDTGSGVVAILKNNNKITVSVNAKLAYYSNGKMIDTASEENYAFESGAECALFFNAPYDSEYKNVDYDDYKITMSVEEGSSSLICGSKGIEVSSEFGEGNVSAEITNNSGRDLSSIIVSCIFYDSSKNAIGYEHHYVECKASGSSDFATFDFPYDENYEAITPDSYVTYVNCAYKYSWES